MAAKKRKKNISKVKQTKTPDMKYIITYNPEIVDISLEVVRRAISFIVLDVIGVCKDININNRISHIYRYDSTNKDLILDDISNISIKDDKFTSLKNKLDSILNESPEEIILTTSYVSTEDFPDDKYYLYNEPNTEGRKQITDEMIDKVLEYQNKKLEELGFVNINNFINYEYQVAFLYTGNEIGKKLADIISEFNKK